MQRGWRDAHLHLAEHGEELSCINLATCRTREECLERVARASRERDASERGGWIKAVGARNESWADPRWPTAPELDEAAGGACCIVLSFDHHALVASGSALRAAGVHAGTPDPAKGMIEKRDGAPTGLLLESAMHLVRRAMPAPTDADLSRWVRRATEDLTRRGITEVHDMLSTPGLARVLLGLESSGQLTLDVRLYATRAEFDALRPMAEQWESERIRLAGLKIFTDGTLNSRTAWMLRDFVDAVPERPHGTSLMSVQEIAESVRYADDLGFPIAAHAIGDGAVRAVLEALEHTAPETLGQRVEHAQFIDEADVPRFAQLGVVASLQPCHLLTDIEAIERYAPHRAERAFPLRDLIDSAVEAGFEASDLVWLGSDAPIVPPAPEDNLQAAVHRRRAGMDPSRAVGPSQAISEAEARECMMASER